MIFYDPIILCSLSVNWLYNPSPCKEGQPAECRENSLARQAQHRIFPDGREGREGGRESGGFLSEGGLQLGQTPHLWVPCLNRWGREGEYYLPLCFHPQPRSASYKWSFQFLSRYLPTFSLGHAVCGEVWIADRHWELWIIWSPIQLPPKRGP